MSERRLLDMALSLGMAGSTDPSRAGLKRAASKACRAGPELNT